MGVDQIGALKQSQTPLITHSSSSCTTVTTLYLIPERRFHGNTTCAPVFLVLSLSEVVPKRLRLYPASCAFVLGDCVRKKVCQAWSKHRKIAPDVINPAQGVLRLFAIATCETFVLISNWSIILDVVLIVHRGSLRD